MKISILGAGYVGLVTGACLAESGNQVAVIDVLPDRVAQINKGICPIHEQGLPELLKKHIGKNLKAFSDAREAPQDTQAYFICVGTPQGTDGSTKMDYVLSAAKDLGKAISKNTGTPLAIVKSTIPPSRLEEIKKEMEKSSGKKDGVGFFFCSNPEFLREGTAVSDFQKPDRIVLGCSSQKAFQALSSIYTSFNAPLFLCDPKTAMAVKYASNAYLATKISFANELGNFCKAIGVDSWKVADGMGFDARIGRKFLDSGCGFGGSCFPKDVSSLKYEMEKAGLKARMIFATLEVNSLQPKRMLEIAKGRAGSLKGKKAGILGLSFKPNTDDVRESPGLALARLLLKEGAQVFAYDPKAMENAKRELPEITYCKSMQEAVSKSDFILIMSDWEEFATLDTGKYVLEGKRVLKLKKRNYEGICW